MNSPLANRDYLSVFALVATPLLLGIGLVLHPEETSNKARQLDTVARHASAWTGGHLFIYLASILAIGATVALVRLADRHHTRGALAPARSPRLVPSRSPQPPPSSLSPGISPTAALIERPPWPCSTATRTRLISASPSSSQPSR
jgi:hypothetical protein